MANATSTLAVFPAYLGGALGFRKEMGAFDRCRLLRLAGVTLAGGSVGSGLLLISSNKTFAVVAPLLLLGATLAFLFGDRVRALGLGRVGRARGLACFPWRFKVAISTAALASFCWRCSRFGA